MKRVVIALLGLFILFNILMILSPFVSFKNYELQYSGYSGITGKGTSGTIGLVILSSDLNISIDSPQNITYNFSIGDNYTIDLNVSADFIVNTWWYTLEDLRHSSIVNQSIIFTPNTTFNAVRWSNKIIVFANDSAGSEVNASVTFYVSVPNSAPILGDINSSILVCESTTLSHDFNATDVDEDILTVDINPKNPFFVNPTTFFYQTFITSEIFSGTLNKNNVGIHSETVSVSDGEFVDTKNTNITVIGINNPPIVQNIGVQTVYAQGDNSTFYKEVNVSDVEDGNQTSGNFTFNLTFLTGTKFFDVDQFGVMNFTANDSLIGVYNLSFCVTDLSIQNPHQNISLCGQDGSNQTACQNFSITVTDENRAPTITSYYPVNLTQNASGTDNLYFNITKYDPDGTAPDAYWYVDGSFNEYDSGSSYDEFTYSFGCGVSGSHTIKVEITDGLLNDSLQWNITVANVDCPEEVSSGGGGGGGIRTGCIPNWVCHNWQVCQNAQTSLEVGILSGEDYRDIQDSCFSQKFGDNFCGVQTRNCFDLKSCNTTIRKPDEFQDCYYVENPGCFDRVKNCHTGGCELLVDCGGPCNPCPTCSDNIQNQEEGGVDCGGPCPWKCIEKEIPSPNKIFFIFFWIFLIILILFIIIKSIRILKLKRRLHQLDGVYIRK